jgi:hypothetical protein
VKHKKPPKSKEKKEKNYITLAAPSIKPIKMKSTPIELITNAVMANAFC